MKPSQLLLPYNEWKALEKPQDEAFQQWLTSWELHDLVAGGTDDDRRRHDRYAYYLGWFAAMKRIPEVR